MILCPHCGKEIPDNVIICPVCGEKNQETEIISSQVEDSSAMLADGTPSAPTAEEPSAEEESPAEEEPPAKGEPPAEEELPAEEESPAKEEPPAEEEPSAEEELPTAEEPSAEEESPAEEEPSAEEELPAEEEPPAEEKAPKQSCLRDRRERRRRKRKSDEERAARKSLLHKVSLILTGIGLFLLLLVALWLIRMSSSARMTAPAAEKAPIPTSPIIINYHAHTDPDRIESEGPVMYVTDELIAISAKDVGYTEMERLCNSRDIRIIGCVELTDTYQLLLPEEYTLQRLDRLALELERESQVERAMPNVVWVPGFDLVPDDPWGDGNLNWKEAENGSGNWGVMAIRAPEAWERFSPGLVRVGVIDGIFDARHEDLSFQMSNSVRKGTRGAYAESSAALKHGTEVASVIGAVHDNGLGLSGVVRDCALYGRAVPGYCSQMDLLGALADLAAEHVPVANCSLSYGEEISSAAAVGDEQVLSRYFEQPADFVGLGLNRMLERGFDFLLVQSAGNGKDGQEKDARWNSLFCYLEEPELRSRVLVVGAAGIGRKDRFYQAPFSNGGERVDVLAPGMKIYCAEPENRYALRSGTSLAAAHASGVCAAAWALSPGLSGPQVRQLVIDTADLPVTDGCAELVDMTAALEKAAESVGLVPTVSERDRALDAYAALLRSGVKLRMRAQPGENGSSADAQYYRLLDMDGDGVEELLLYCLDSGDPTASFALYAWQNGGLTQIANAWDTCRFSSWTNASLSLEIWDGAVLYAAAEKSSAGYGELGERFWLSYDGSQVSCVKEERERNGEWICLIVDSALTDEGIRIGSAADLLWNRG